MTKIKTGDGKYVTLEEAGHLRVYRNGVPSVWREDDLIGDGYVLSLVQRIEDLEGMIPIHLGETFIPNRAAVHEPAPIGDGQVILDLVRKDFEDRAAAGEIKYGTKLRAYNGRDTLMDAYQEAVDLCMYLRQAMYERDGK
jgi:hypothetical protein